MIIRTATEQDIPAIVQLSKESLGEVEGMRTEEYWKWKHLQNPFGGSPVLLAYDDTKLIGLRSFMQWRFRKRGEQILAYRAVDTATHPQYQGRRIFSTLTSKLIDQLMSGDPSLIFNTPNDKSMPGYIKMGWHVVGKTRLRVKVYPWNVIQNRMMSYEIKQHAPLPVVFPEEMSSLVKAWQRTHDSLMMTDYSMDYLRWRYQEVPVLNYGSKVVRKGNSMVVIIYRLKKSKKIYELRLVEIIYTGTDQKDIVQTAIHNLAEEYRPDVITVLADAEGRLDAVLPFGFFKAEQQGLTITGRRVNNDELGLLLKNYQEWYLSSGGLELF